MTPIQSPSYSLLVKGRQFFALNRHFIPMSEIFSESGSTFHDSSFGLTI